MFKNLKNAAAIAIINFLEKRQVKSDQKFEGNTFLEFARSWLQARDRGGLVHVDDEFYIFIRKIENAVRNCLNVNLIRKYRGQDLQDDS